MLILYHVAANCAAQVMLTETGVVLQWFILWLRYFMANHCVPNASNTTHRRDPEERQRQQQKVCLSLTTRNSHLTLALEKLSITLSQIGSRTRA